MLRSGRIGQTFSEMAAAVWPKSWQRQVAQAQQNDWHIDLPEQFCPRCGASSGPSGYTDDGCAFCVGKRIAWDKIVRLAAYSPPVDQWIIAMKFHRDWSWAIWFGQQLGRQIQKHTLETTSAVCYVPMHWRRRVRRGYDQAYLIAKAVADVCPLPIADVLKRRRYTRPQTSVVASNRNENVRNTFSMKRVDLTGWDMWLVDDVKTSGSTIAACTGLLRRAGARRINVAVAAVADPRNADFQAV